MTFFRKKVVFLISILIIFGLAAPSVAESPMSKARRVKKQIASMRSDLSHSFKSYKEKSDKLEELNKKVTNNTAKLSKLAADLKYNQKLLSARIGSMYRYDQVSFLNILFGANTFNDMLLNFDFVTRVSFNDARVIKRVKKLKSDLAATQKNLVKDRNYQKKLVREQKKENEYINAKITKAKKMLTGLKKEIAELAKPKPLPPPVASQIIAPSAPTTATNGNYAFPVASPYSFSNDWGAPRRGHTHQGNDILASMGAPTYAVIGGTVSNTEGKSAGKWQTLRGDDGNTYWYMHQSGFAISGRVETGQVIGYAGNTGNAAGGPPHVHFELHPGGGGAINPYFFLTSIQ